MLKIIIGSGREDTLEFNGSGKALCTSILCAILSVYKTLAAHDPRAAAEFRRLMQMAITSPIFWSIETGRPDHICIIQPNSGKGGRS